MRGGIVKLTIPVMGTSLATDDVRYFFTASVNGCSIFIKDTPQSPQIFHAGGSTGHGKDPVKAAQFWRNLMTRHSGAGDVEAEVNKMDYMSAPGTASGFTPHLEEFKSWLDSTSTNGLKIERVDPWGCVMGIRDLAGNSSFYLQENADVVHATFTKKHLFSLKKTVKGTTYSSARPMLFRKFFPGGLAHVDFVPTMPRKL